MAANRASHRTSLALSFLLLLASQGAQAKILLSNEIIWETNPPDSTSQIALGDIDLDGDLDVVCANGENDARPNTVYLNGENGLSETPDRLSGSTKTWGVALGDINGDGFLDAFFGNTGKNNLYWGNGRTFDAEPWESEDAVPTRAVAMCDIDNDGDLDVVCANVGPNTIYRNIEGALQPTPETIDPSVSNFSTSVALGDLDGNEFIDIVFGNASAANTLYLNAGDHVTKDPWSPNQRATAQIALGDVNGDGLLDLVCGSADPNAPLEVFRNIKNETSGEIFAPIPHQTFGNQSVSGLALGDLDADGDLDLATSTAGMFNLVYENIADSTSPETIFVRSQGDWKSGRKDITHGVSLGDLNGDGTLDLLYANIDAPNIAYPNLAMGFERSSSWDSSPDAKKTNAIALGDLNNDGVLDMVCGETGDPPQTSITIYYSQDGVMDFVSSDVGEPGWATSAALGDLDGDGAQDIILGYRADRNLVIYSRQGADSLAFWTNALNTSSLALGDVNGDGHLDVVRGDGVRSYEGEPNDVRPTTLHRWTENGLVLEWSERTPHNTLSVELGDLDRNGYLDLVCGNNKRNTIYLNHAGVLDSVPILFTAETPTVDIALGDVDGDGLLDLLCANDSDGIDLFLNDYHSGEPRVIFPLVSWHASPDSVNRVLTVNLGDLDGDGHLDAVFGTELPSLVYQTLVFFNTGDPTTPFRQSPDWRFDRTPGRPEAIALADVDSDGDLEIVCANRSSENTIYSNFRWPPGELNPRESRNRLPSSSAFLRFVKVKPIDSNHYGVSGEVFDVESDPVRIVVDYQFAGVPEWVRATDTPFLGPFASSPDGEPWSFEWDITTLPTIPRDVVLRLRVIENPTRISSIQSIPSYNESVGLVAAHRPALAPPSPIDFPPITVGDIAMVQVELCNNGNEPLSISHIDQPSSALRVEPTALELAPGVCGSLSVFLEPRCETDVSGSLTLVSNDKLNPGDVPVTTTIRALEVSAEIPLEPALGDPITFVVTPATGVHIESGRVLFRPKIRPDTNDAYMDVPLRAVAQGNLVGTIRGTYVTEADLEYYIEVENGGVFGTFPPTECALATPKPPDNPASLIVAIPPDTTLFSLSPDCSPCPEGEDIQIDAQFHGGMSFQGGTLFFRLAGDTHYRSVVMIPGELFPIGKIPVGTIPAEFVTARGVEYYGKVHTLQPDSLTDPADTPESVPLEMRTYVKNLREESRHAGEQYRMLSIPLDFENSFENTIETLLSDQPEFLSYEKTRWRAYRYLKSCNCNVELPDGDREDFHPFPGRAFWLISRDPHQVDTAPIRGVSTPSNEPYPIQLKSGWNQFGNPFAFPVAWSSVTTWPENSQIGLGEILAYDPSHPDSEWVSTKILQPFEGYFVMSLDAVATDTLWIPPTAANNPDSAKTVLQPSHANKRDVAFEPVWQIHLEARTDGSAHDAVTFGVHADAVDGYDASDHNKPPPRPQETVSLGISHADWQRPVRLYRSDFRSPDGEGWTWELEVTTAAASREVTFHGFQDVPLPEGLAVALIDREQGSVVRGQATDTKGLFRDDPRILAFGPHRGYRVAFIVGTVSFLEREQQEHTQIPSQLVLDQNVPNPFNAYTRIRYGLPNPGSVTMEVYDPRGRLVNRMISRSATSAGYHSLIWDGTDAFGRSIGSGVYFYRLTVGDRIITRRVVLIK